jgi:hypothetical protein
MRATRTFFVDLNRLRSIGADAEIIIQMMRAADDIALANWGLGVFTEEQPSIKRHIQAGACRYFLRLQCGHLCEAIRLVEKFNNSTKLIEILSSCPSWVQAAHGRLQEVLPGGERRNLFVDWILPIRNKLAFHYDDSLIKRALERILQDRNGGISTITCGSEMQLWRHGVADDLEDTIVCRLLWNIPPEADLRFEADLRAEFGAELCKDFLDFAGWVIISFIREHAAL